MEVTRAAKWLLCRGPRRGREGRAGGGREGGTVLRSGVVAAGKGPAGKGRPAPCWKVAASQPWPQSRPGGGGEQWVSGQYPVSMARWKCQNTHKAVQGTCHSVTRGQEQSLVPVVSLTSAWTPHTDHQSVRPTTLPRSPPPPPRTTQTTRTAETTHTAQIPPCCRGHPPCTDHPPCINPALLDHPHCSGSRCICPLGNDSSRCGEAVVCLLVLIAPPREAGRQTSVPPL